MSFTISEVRRSFTIPDIVKLVKETDGLEDILKEIITDSELSVMEKCDDLRVKLEVYIGVKVCICSMKFILMALEEENVNSASQN